MMASCAAGVGVSEPPRRMPQHLAQLDAVADAADAAGHERGDVAVTERPFHYGRQFVADLHVLEPARVVAPDLLVEHRVVDGFQFLS